MSDPITPDKIGGIINSLMEKAPLKSIAFNNNLGYYTIAKFKENWPLFCGLARYNKAGDDDDS